MPDDRELLESYARNHSESAFTELVGRQVDLVYSAALREAHGDAALAGDITQAVFTELARKAGRLSRHPALAGWLYTCVRRMTANARRAEHNRRRRELEAHTMKELLAPDSSESGWRQIQPVLDDAMHELSETDRAAVVLRYFQDRSHREVGLALGLEENAARMRVERALEKLRTVLARRGITSTTAGLAAAVTAGAIASAPSGLAAGVASTAILTSGASTALTVFNLMSMAKMKAGVIATVFAVGAVTSLVVIQHETAAAARELDGALQRQSAQLAGLQPDARKHGQITDPAAGPGLNTEEELLRLRGQVAALRSKTNQIAQMQEKNRELQASLKLARSALRDPNQQSSVWSKDATEHSRFGRDLVLAAMNYADKHDDQYPSNLADALPFLPAEARQQTNLDWSNYEFVYHGKRDAMTNYANAVGNGILAVRERQPWRNTDGLMVKAESFLDGSGTLMSFQNGDFEPWEKRHTLPPPRAP